MQVKQDKIPQRWKETTLGEVAEIIMGQSPPGDSCNNVGEGTPLLNGPTEFGNHHPTPIQFTIDPRRYARKGDILFCVRGSTTGRMNWADRDYAIGRGIAAIRHKKGYKFQTFLRALIQYKLPDLLGIATGSTFPSISRPQLNHIICEFPDEPRQYTIANIFGSFDDKIELLRRQNKTLEKIAQKIFKEWFVNFNFPDKNGKPYKSSVGKMIDSDSEFGEIPEDWRVGTVNDVIERFSITYRCDKEDIEPGGKTPILDQGSTGLYGHTSRQADFEASTENPVIVFANHTCNMWFINYPFCAIQNIIPFRGNAEYSTFFVFYMTLGQISFIAYKGHWPDFEQKEYVIPKPDVANKFAEIVKPFQYKIWNDNSQIQTLSRLRDYLLPKLMKGEIRVKS